MVVIDHHETDDRNAILSNAASDGFETASDTDLDSDVDANDGSAIKQEEQDNHQQQSDQQQEQGDPQRIISSDDASINNEELIQGKYENTVKECTKALELNPMYVKALVRRGEANEKLEHFEEAIADMKKILEIDPSNDQAGKSIRRLEPLAAVKREKMKEEMIAKLKDMGNSLLGRFGMSVDNFKAVQDPNTGSYSVSFQ
ncbi:hypothetical protein TSUD_104980, partial [Trifolium subterraneum]